MFSLVKDKNTCPKIAGKILDKHWRVAGESGGRGEGGEGREGKKRQKGYVEGQIKLR